MRLGRPGSADEATGGDGAAAFLFGEGDDVVAEIVSQASVTAEFLDRWRTPGTIASGIWEERFGLGQYKPLIEEAATRALESAGVEAPDRVVIASPHARAAAGAAKQFGEAATRQDRAGRRFPRRCPRGRPAHGRPRSGRAR